MTGPPEPLVVVRDLAVTFGQGANEMQAASGAFKKATKLDIKFGPAWANIGTLYAMYGNEDKARDAFFKAGGADLTSPDVLPNAAAAKGGR